MRKKSHTPAAAPGTRSGPTTTHAIVAGFIFGLAGECAAPPVGMADDVLEDVDAVEWGAGGEDEDEGGADGEGEDDEGNASDAMEEEELDPKHHPLLRPGAMPRMSRAAVEAVVGMVEQDMMGGGRRRAASAGSEEDEDELDD